MDQNTRDYINGLEGQINAANQDLQNSQNALSSEQTNSANLQTELSAVSTNLTTLLGYQKDVNKASSDLTSVSSIANQVSTIAAETQASLTGFVDDVYLSTVLNGDPTNTTNIKSMADVTVAMDYLVSIATQTNQAATDNGELPVFPSLVMTAITNAQTNGATTYTDLQSASSNHLKLVTEVEGVVETAELIVSQAAYVLANIGEIVQKTNEMVTALTKQQNDLTTQVDTSVNTTIPDLQKTVNDNQLLVNTLTAQIAAAKASAGN